MRARGNDRVRIITEKPASRHASGRTMQNPARELLEGKFSFTTEGIPVALQNYFLAFGVIDIRVEIDSIRRLDSLPVPKGRTPQEIRVLPKKELPDRLKRSLPRLLSNTGLTATVFLYNDVAEVLIYPENAAPQRMPVRPTRTNLAATSLPDVDNIGTRPRRK
ncbi:hypothetical protein ACFL31_00930 [Candidatus Margulisiibacteriota bacterium]